jgi:hypothetical protein
LARAERDDALQTSWQENLITTKKGGAMATIKRFAAALCCYVATCSQATDLSDLWLNFAEAGWGVNVSHQADILFLTFFVYGPDQQPHWYSASSVQYQATNASGHQIYSGQLAQTTGPWFGSGTFNPSAVAANVVGNVTFTATTVTTATMTYNVGATSVSKQLTRYAFRGNANVNGNYFGGVVGDVSNCALPSSNGHFEGSALVAISGNSTNTQVTLQSSTGACTMSGPYSQSGRMGRVLGTLFCTSGASGSVDIFEVEANNSGVTARYQAAYSNGCREIGHFGGVSR